MSPKFVILYSLFLFTTIGCTTYVNPSEDAKVQLHIESEISSNRAVVLDMTLSQVIGANPLTSLPETADIFLTGDGLQGEVGFIYYPVQNQYILRQTSFRPVEGGEYNLRAHWDEEGIDTIFAYTRIPEGKEIVSQEIRNVENVLNDKNLTDTDITVDIDLGEIDGDNVFHLIPSYKFAGSETSEVFQIKDIIQKNAIDTWIHRDGVIVEKSKLSNGILTLTLSTNDNYDASQFSLENIEWEVRVVSEDYYEYNIYLDKVNRCPSTDCAIPYFTNVDRGRGFLGSYAVRNQSFPIN